MIPSWVTSPMIYVGAGSETAGTLPALDRVPVARPAERQAREADAPAFGLIGDRAGFDALEAEWNDLFRRAGRPTQLFQTFNWNWHWANHFLPREGASDGTTLAIVTVRRLGRLAMLWPLVLRRVGRLKALHWIGEPASQYGDILAEDLPDTPELMRQAWHFVTTRLGADALHLRKVRADAAVAPLLRELGLSPCAAAEAPHLDLASAPDFPSYEKRYTAKARKNRRRLARRLAEQGPCAFERHVGGREARAAVLHAIALKRTWAERTGRVSAAFADPRLAGFFADVAEGSARPAGCGVTVLRSNGELAGVAIDISCLGHRAAHVIAHDPRFDRFSAGTLLLEAWIRGASEDGMATFDLLAPVHPYKQDWADGTVAVADFAAGLSLAGRAYVAVYIRLVRPALKTAAEGLPHAISAARALARAIGLERAAGHGAAPTS